MEKNLLTTLEKAKYNIPCLIKKTENNSKLDIYKLYNVGITENAEITPLFSSIFNGTKAYLVKGSVIALRDNDAKEIIVHQCV